MPGVYFSAFQDPVIGGNDETVSFFATIKGSGITAANNAGIWSERGGKLTLVARTGQAPLDLPGAKFNSFVSLATPSRGPIGPLFVATLAIGPGNVTAANNTGLWGVTSEGTSKLLIREGDSVKVRDQFRVVKTFDVFEAVAGAPGVARSFNDNQSVACRVNFTDGRQGIVILYVP